MSMQPHANQDDQHLETVDLCDATLGDLAAAFDAGTLSAESLVVRSLARMEAFDRQGPCLRAVISLNPLALDTARALDEERARQGPRGPLHGIPVVLKDNIDTGDMPTTAGSVLLEGAIPPDDAFIVQQLRAAGAIILAKVNMSEFASGGTFSSILGYSRNPHDLARSTSGSSGGTAVAVAAGYAPIGIGTDTGGSIRGPAAAQGLVALKPTRGLLSRDGIIPLSPTLDTAGPMARHVEDLAAVLGVMTSVDPADEGTRASEGRSCSDYTRQLDAQALRGARLGVARDFAGADADVDWVFEASLDALQRAGAQLVDVRYPAWLLALKDSLFDAIRLPEFAPNLAQYLASLGPAYPKSLNELIERARTLTAGVGPSGVPNPGRWAQFEREAASGPLTDYRYESARVHGLGLVQSVVTGLMATHQLDAVVYPTAIRRAALVAGHSADPTGPAPGSAANIANLSGLPDLVVPAGLTGDRLPVCLSFLGPAFSEARLLSLGYAFEQATRARRQPVHAPALPGDAISRPRARSSSEATRK
jgi:amidase